MRLVVPLVFHLLHEEVARLAVRRDISDRHVLRHAGQRLKAVDKREVACVEAKQETLGIVDAEQCAALLALALHEEGREFKKLLLGALDEKLRLVYTLALEPSKTGAHLVGVQLALVAQRLDSDEELAVE